MSRLLTPEEIEALRADTPYIPAPRERFDILVDAGRAELTPEEIAALRPGDVVLLHRRVDAPVDILANAVAIARGVMTERDGRAAVRIVSLAHPHVRPPSGS